MFKPQDCVGTNQRCIRPTYQYNELSKLKVALYISRYSSSDRRSDMKLAWDSGDTSIMEKQDVDVNLTLPYSTRRNGSLYAFVYVYPIGKSPFDNEKSTFQSYQLTKYAIPKDKAFNLIQGIKENKTAQSVTHIFPRISIYVSVQQAIFDRYAIPSDIYQLLRIDNRGNYLPLLYIDGLSCLQRHLVPVSKETDKIPIKVYFTPVS